MIRQLIVVQNKWNILIWYGISKQDGEEVYQQLLNMGCPIPDAEYATNVVSRYKNTGLTFSDTDSRVSFVCVSSATSYSQFVDTIVHEIKHVQSHICEYYDVDEYSEDAAYLIGYIARQIYKLLSKYKRKL